ncbi:MAG: SDR family oxidoreductase [Methylophaga sp.]
MNKVLVTGANGFVGRALVKAMTELDITPVAAVRNNCGSLAEQVGCVEVGDLSPEQDWFPALENIQTIVHTAGRVHVMKDDESDSMELFRLINTASTLNLARQAAKAGVKRFVFLSTIKVLGESTTGRLPYSEKDSCNPADPYAISKMEAETGLMKLAEETGMEIVIIRPPLIYGPGVKGNLASMQHWIARGIPLPLGAVHNQRSLLALENLVDFICHCIDDRRAANQIFVISDGEDISTTELIHKLAAAQGKKPRLLPVPAKMMRFTAGLLGKSGVAERLFGSLQIDSRKARDLLGWSPKLTIDEQLKKMAL